MQVEIKELDFYTVDNDYLKYLYNFDSQVFYSPSYSQAIKPFVGIVLGIENYYYFIPLTSAKEKHIKNRIATNDYLTIYDIVDKSHHRPNAIYKPYGNDKNKKYHLLSVLELKKMIPVPLGVFSAIDFETLNQSCRNLFQKEYEFCKRHMQEITEKVSKLHYLTRQKGDRISKLHCHYPLLEKVMREYEGNNSCIDK